MWLLTDEELKQIAYDDPIGLPEIAFNLPPLRSIAQAQLRKVAEQLINHPTLSHHRWLWEEFLKEAASAIIFICAPYADGDRLSEEQRLENVRRACQVGAWVVELGYVPLVPHLSHYMVGMAKVSEKDWLRCSLVLLGKCDGVIRLDGQSEGVKRELLRAWALKMRIVLLKEFSLTGVRQALAELT